MTIQVGDTAPHFRLPANDGQTYDLNELRGRRFLFYFYPKANTGGWTIEALGFRENIQKFEDRGIMIIGISPDTIEAQQEFCTKNSLPFPLLADVGAHIAQEYGVWVERERDGKKFMGIERSTFLIDEQGKIGKIWRKVSPQGHAEEILSELDAEPVS